MLHFLTLGAFAFWVFASSSFAASNVKCSEPSTIKDFVACQNKLIQARASTVSDYLAAYSGARSRLACTRSQASAQPAAPDQGDLRCFLVFRSGATVSFNLVSGTNENQIEVSEATKADDGDDGVLLAFFTMTKPIAFKDALASSSSSLNELGLKCSSCHQVIGRDQIKRDGFGAWVLEPIKINSTVRRTIPRNGQVPPETLDRVLSDLATRHGCAAVFRKRIFTAADETCLRLKISHDVSGRFPLDNP